MNLSRAEASQVAACVLTVRGLAEECGIEKRAGAGRPQIAYRIALDRIVGGA